MRKYRGFVGLGLLRSDIDYASIYSRYAKITPTLQPRPVIQVPITPTEPAPVLEPTPEPVARIMSCPPSCPTGYSPTTGQLLPGWVQPQCIKAPCPAMYVGVTSPGQQEIEYRQYQEGGDGTATEIERNAKIDEAMKRLQESAGTGITFTRKPPEAAKPNLLPLALAAGAAYFFLM